MNNSSPLKRKTIVLRLESVGTLYNLLTHGNTEFFDTKKSLRGLSKLSLRII